MRKRLDILAAETLGVSRSKAQALIMAGAIFVDDKVITKSGTEIDEGAVVQIKEVMPYVSRGALKLEKAAKEFDIDFSGKVICDIGASTGGFTDYALQNGALKVYAVDTGYGQLDQKLRADKRVINMERTNIKDVDALPEPIDIFVIDVSFISLKKVLPQVITIIRNSPARSVAEGEGGSFEIRHSSHVVALVKPQFEVGKKVADKYKGVIRDESIRREVLEDIKNFAGSIGFRVLGTTKSPITGAKGNREHLLYLSLRA